MKNQKNMKKLALMGITAGMLLSDNVEASFSNSENDQNTDINSYLAAKCGSKCGGSVAERTSSPNYYYESCNSQQSNGSCHSYTKQNGCNSQQSRGSCHSYAAQNSCNSQPYYNPSQWATNDAQQNPNQQKPATGTNPQNSSKYAGNNDQGKQTQGNQGKNNNGYGQVADNNQNQNNQKKQVPPQGQINSKYQASNGCGGEHGCHGGQKAGNSNGESYQASGCGGSNRSPSNNGSGSYYYNPYQVAEADQHATPPTLNESDLVSKLNAQGKATYNSLTPEGKKLALQLANADCKGKNTCKGLNACKSDKNECAGKGGCKGQSVGPFKDKNLAVKVAASKMAEKRNSLQNKNQ